MPTATYDAIADWYDALVRSDSFVGDVVLAPLFTLLGAVQNQYICDLACGQGRLARAFARMARTLSASISQPSCLRWPNATKPRIRSALPISSIMPKPFHRLVTPSFMGWCVIWP